MRDVRIYVQKPGTRSGRRADDFAEIIATGPVRINTEPDGMGIEVFADGVRIAWRSGKVVFIEYDHEHESVTVRDY